MKTLLAILALTVSTPALAGAISGTSGDDSLRPTTGTDYIYGGAGNDTLNIDNKLSEVKLNRASDGSWRIFYPGTGDTDFAYSIERIVFTDVELALRGLSPADTAPAIDTAKIADLLSQAQRLLKGQP